MSDRPLHRRAVKLAFALLGRSRAHWQETWPGLEIRRVADGRPGEVRLRGRRVAVLQPLSLLSRRAGDTITIVGSGPSIREIDPQRLPGYPILLNGALSLGLDGALAVEDERFVWRRLEMLREMLRPSAPRLLSPAVIRLLAARAPELIADAPLILMENAEKPAGRLRRPGLPPVSDTPEAGVIVAGTVAFSALQMALGASARRIAFAGVDLGNADAPRFYESAKDRAPSGLLAGQDRILSHFAAASRLAAERGVTLETVTPGSALETIGVPYRPL